MSLHQSTQPHVVRISASFKKVVYIFFTIRPQDRNVALNLVATNTLSPRKVV